ncbi:hypothetical protein SynRS9907_02571 [Synechococcus sp. RS9907]|nr:hypothetical protein SynRS9907_02571 [Synechococcus sp. RS9907]
MNEQFPVGHLQDCGEERQHLGQRLRVTPVSGRKNRYDLHEIAGNHWQGDYSPSKTTKK